jgi:hypothetical protein
MKVTIWHRQGLLDLAPGTHQVPADLIDQHFRGYQPGDPIKPVYGYEHPTGPNVTTHDAHQIAEQAFQMFNGMAVNSWEEDHADRYYAAGNRSLSVGDLVVIGEIAMSCESSGWAFVTIPTQTGS